jgi:hypothetical protein
VTATDRERIQGLLAEGWRLLEAGDPRQAALVFGRVALVEPTRGEALRGLAAANAAITEVERRSDERLGEARRALECGDHAAARAFLEAVIAEGGDRHEAHALLDRLDQRGGRLERAEPPSGAAEAPSALAPPPRVSWSRRAFAAAWTVALLVLGAGLFSSWDRLLVGLTRPPASHAHADDADWRPPVTRGDRALAQARRLMDSGNAAAALAVLDRVGADEPAYPFARQLRQQAERVLTGEPVAMAQRGGKP